MSRPKPSNIGVAHGAWGEEVASEYLKRRGFKIVDRNVHPCRWDQRLEIDIIAYDPYHDTMIFVEVKQHKDFSSYQRRLRSITRRKRQLLRIACRAWLYKTQWQTGRRFDVIEIYGEPESANRPMIDHIENVSLFETRERFVNWDN